MGAGASRGGKQPEGDSADTAFEQAARALAKAKRVCFFTGAGISVDSGIPDFRSPGGLWTRFNPMVYCSYEVFLKTPSKFWE